MEPNDDKLVPGELDGEVNEDMLPELVYGREGDAFLDSGRGTDVEDNESFSTRECDCVVDVNKFGEMIEGIDNAKSDTSACKTSSS